ncbi:MarR family winged helix-turn-helix transcriptional regulator [Lentibacter sp. XHP0401]|jgi:DNA-binding MarR family transcriptional regulator|uniref:MarR family winged helix-turn-helix transcriptional regulator n=1 Tax=Lentibacter sp. XHP0401 TaxID=2984334 RepID=UPI0021E8EB8F|nr:MarR family winged helix-turn-helix transcriptional regulator [Lentibacter sp. XHP0401]MCV2892535.1 MarR family winged helix-turn-helix transcriptional regulator [Lentibacter sp. XHP0401]
MNSKQSSLAIALISEILATDQLLRSRLTRVLPAGMEISHFSVLTHLAYTNAEKTPAQLAKTFHVTKGAMTNTLNKLQWAGYVHIRPDWDDARRKMVAISPAGRQARDTALSAIEPMIKTLVDEKGAESIRAALPVLRDMRLKLESND